MRSIWVCNYRSKHFNGCSRPRASIFLFCFPHLPPIIPNNPQVQTQSPNTHPTNDHRPHLCTPMQPVEPRCNLSKAIDTRKLVGLFRDDATRQPDEPDTIFKNPRDFSKPGPRGNQSGCISVKGWDELGMDGTRGTTGEPTIYS